LFYIAWFGVPLVAISALPPVVFVITQVNFRKKLKFPYPGESVHVGDRFPLLS
jgi:hypothetical protein